MPLDTAALNGLGSDERNHVPAFGQFSANGHGLAGTLTSCQPGVPSTAALTPLIVPGYPKPGIPNTVGPLLLCLDRLETRLPAAGLTFTLYWVGFAPKLGTDEFVDGTGDGVESRLTGNVGVVGVVAGEDAADSDEDTCRWAEGARYCP